MQRTHGGALSAAPFRESARVVAVHQDQSIVCTRMLLEITTTCHPATDLGYLLEKHPDRVQHYDLAGGRATLFYREASPARCTAVLLLDIDPVGLIRGRGHSPADVPLQHYVNDRPYVASSFMSVALGTVFRSALAGKSRYRPALAATPIPLVARIPVLAARGGEKLLQSLFEPLGYTLSTERLPLDPAFPAWGPSPYFTVALCGTTTVRELLQHLYVLMPVLDDDKHYWVGDEEVEKLMRHAGEWLDTHPAREIITSRYLKHQRSLACMALKRLVDDEQDEAEAEATPDHGSQRERLLESRINLNLQRLDTVSRVVADLGATTCIDLGCGEGRLLGHLLHLKQLTRVAGMDVSMRSLAIARERLKLEQLPARQQERISLFQGSLIYRDQRLSGYDVATVIEVIEHLDAGRLATFERVMFEFAHPRAIVLTTPNVEYNARFPNLPAGQLRHADHRFEWTRAEFQSWADRQAQRFGYSVAFDGIGEVDAALGAPTQLAVFKQVQ